MEIDDLFIDPLSRCDGDGDLRGDVPTGERRLGDGVLWGDFPTGERRLGDGDLRGDAPTGERRLGDGDHEEESKASCGCGKPQLDRSSFRADPIFEEKRPKLTKTTELRLELPKRRIIKWPTATTNIATVPSPMVPELDRFIDPLSRCDGNLRGDVPTGERRLGDGDREEESKASCGSGISQLDRSWFRADTVLRGDVPTGERRLGDGDHEEESKASCGSGKSQLDRSSFRADPIFEKKWPKWTKTTKQRLGVLKRKIIKSKRATTYISTDPCNFRQMVQQVTGIRFRGKEVESKAGLGDSVDEGDTHRTANLLQGLELRPWKPNSSINSYAAEDQEAHSESDVRSHCLESEFNDTVKKTKIKGGPEYHKREALESAALQMRDTAEPQLEHCSLEVKKDTAPEEVRSYPSEQQSKVDSYCLGPKYEVGDKKVKTEPSLEHHDYEIMHTPIMRKESSAHKILDDNKASIDMLVSGAKQERIPQACGAINYDSIVNSKSEGSQCSESESECTDKKMKIEASPKYQKRGESAALQMGDTAKPDLKQFSLEVDKGTALEEVHLNCLEQPSEVDSYFLGPEYEFRDRKMKTEAILEYHEIMQIQKLRKESSAHGILDDNKASIDMLVSGAKQERIPQARGAINYDSIVNSESDGSHCSESESECTDKKMKIEASPKDQKRGESAALQMGETAKPDLKQFSLEVDKGTALEGVHLNCLEQPSEVDSYFLGPEYELRDRKMKTEAILEYHEIMRIQKLQKESSPHATLDDNAVSIDMLVSGAKQERRQEGCGAINYDSVVNHLIKSIGRSNITKLGIYGKNEVGKATVIEALKESTILRNLFDRVICVSVPLNCNVDEVQKEMARQISSDLTDANVVDMPHSVVNALEGLKFLLILVGINKPMKLETLRIVDPTPAIGSKIVFLTESGQLCDEIEVDEKICLDELLSWELFCQNVGRAVHSTRVQDLAGEIVRICGHSSHAVILVARALQNVDDILIWKNALERLSMQPASHEAGIEALMVNVLRFSIDQLEDDKTRRCLKNLALCNNYYEIALECAIGLWVRDGLVETHNEGQKVLTNLVHANLVKVAENGQFVKFQDQDQDILVNLIFQPEENRVFLMRGGLDLTEPPEAEEWESAKEICLMHTGISELPKEPRCPSLSLLFLQRNHKLRKLPSSFFNQMPALEVLNLSRTRIRCLPESLSQLVSLKRLFLNECVLLRLISPEIGRLKQLEVLDLEGTKIINLPKEIECLINLTSLGISIEPSDDSKPVIPHGLISSLLNLEELNLNVDPDAEWWNTCAEGIVSEVCKLKRLSTIKFSFPRLELLRQFNQLRKLMGQPSLAQYRFLVGSHASRIMNRLPSDIEFELERCERCLRYINGDSILTDIEDILQQSDALFLERHANLKTLSELGRNSMDHLKWCVLGECNELEVLIDASDTMHQQPLTEPHSKSICLESLEFLYVYCMRNLRNVWKGSVQKGCLTSLKFLTLCRCPELTIIFSHEMLGNLNNLEEVTIEDCPAIKSLISCQNSTCEVLETSYFLPMLKKLSLHYVPKLSRISCGLRIAPRLERLSFYDCPSLKSLSTDEVSSEHLKKIRAERSWWKDLEWRGHKPDRLDGVFVPIDTCDVP